MAKKLRELKSIHYKIMLFATLSIGSAMLFSCSSYNFVKLGKHQNYKSKPINCDIQIVTELPEIPLIEIGICTAESFNEMKNRPEHAIDKLKECGCANGGDYILLGTSDQQIFSRKGSSVFVSGKIYSIK